MTSLGVDTGRLTQQAGTLGGQLGALSQVRDELANGTATAVNNRGSVNDDGLGAALQRLNDAWGYEVAAIASDLGALANIMAGLAKAYAQLDGQGASAVDGG